MEPLRYKRLLSQSELFQPARNTYFEIGEGYDSHGTIADEDIDDWVAREVREHAWQIFAGVVASDGYSTVASGGPKAAPVPKLPFSAKAFDRLVRDCKIPFQVLEMYPRYTNAGCVSKFTTFNEPSGKVGIIGFLLMMRLRTSITTTSALSHDPNTGITTGLIIRIVDDDSREIQAMLQHYRSLIGQPLLLTTILLDIGLYDSVRLSLETKANLAFIELHTGQHTWSRIVADRSSSTSPQDTTVGSLMKLAHGAKIEVAVAQRKSRVILSVSNFLQQLSGDPLYLSAPPMSSPQGNQQIKEWIDHLSSQAEMEAADVSFLLPRTENQISAVSQRADGNSALARGKRLISGTTYTVIQYLFSARRRCNS
ncbi:hypothetical protein GP486_002661 [Trichoglossum hirsutum]|uniref:Uncharacterized protein n=1 Tax=Trichoglossum hirsutum TaxID=265104 RepID=A0A9P8LDV6_9PEZI|nr:hypothetical protein GP486_002661 [Trichoglossum hirsutum]